MPNTLAHIGVQGFLTRFLLRGSDVKWICLGCILPDIPWILQRFLNLLFPGIDGYDLRLYVVIQGSLAFCLLLGLAFSLLSSRIVRSFSILALNACLHLVLDASQIKWAGGVHFFAPFSWRMTSFGLYWPESLPTILITLLGLIFFLIYARGTLDSPVGLKRRPPSRLIGAFFLATVYVLLPFAILDGPANADNHYVRTLRDRSARVGRQIEIDRNRFEPTPNGGIVRTFTGEAVSVEGVDLDRPAVVSIRGTFVAEDRVRVEDYHVHSSLRNIASYIGLSLVLILWLFALARPGTGNERRISPLFSGWGLP